MNRLQNLLQILVVSTKLGFTSFGGPIAHLGYFHEQYVQKRKWLDEKSYAELIALTQFLPGPASSQVGIGIGMIRGGLLGGILSFIGFTLPSSVALMVLALFVSNFHLGDAGWIHGLKITAVAVVAHAIISMARTLTPDLKRKAVALIALVISLICQVPFSQVMIIIVFAFVGFLLFRDEQPMSESQFIFPVSRSIGSISLLLFFALLIVLPILSAFFSSSWMIMFDIFYRSGALVFGGGHVVLPLLERELIPIGLISEEAFLAGYGAAQAVPGPLFTFASYIGAVIAGWQGGLIATVAIFLPAFLLVVGVLPFWEKIRHYKKIRGALMAVNAAVVGILISAFYHPIWTSSILSPYDFAFAAILYSMLTFWKLPPWLIVLIGAYGGLLLK